MDPAIVQALQVAVEHHRAGRFAQAEGIYRQVLGSDPNNAEALFLLGVLARQAGQGQDAVELISRAIALEPKAAKFHAELGETWIVLNQPDKALGHIKRALELDPQMPAYNNLGHALMSLGRIDEAIAALKRGTRIRSDDFIAFSNLGVAYSMAGRSADAMAALRRATELQPNDIDSLCNLAIALRSAGELEEALQAARRAVELAPASSEALNTLGDVLLARNELNEAESILRRALERSPRDPVILTNLGVARQRLGMLDAAVANLREAVRINPHFPEAHHNLGITLRTLGEVNAAIAEFREVLRIRPGFVTAHDALLLSLLYRQTDLALIINEHRAWEERHVVTPLPSPHPSPGVRQEGQAARSIRVGYVSADFREHPIATFVEPLLAAHDPQAVEVFCYSDVAIEDDLTKRIRGHAHHWRRITAMIDSAVADLIRQDRIDILVDLSLHSGNNRLLVFAQKPAPIQVSYLGYCFSPGLSAIDYRFSDEVVDPPAAPAIGPEEVWRLAGSFCCYQPPTDAPDVIEQPCASNGYITFGSFNNLAKIGDDTLKLWAKVLDSVPGSQLVIQAQGADQPSVRERLARLIAPQRLILRGLQPMGEYLTSMSAVDVALDTFPFNGHTTTCHAAWMGVPTVTLCGELPLSRVGASLMRNLALDDLVAASDDEFVGAATQLVADRSRLIEIRQSLRDRMRRSVLMDRRGLARKIEDAYRDMWRRWCKS